VVESKNIYKTVLTFLLLRHLLEPCRCKQPDMNIRLLWPHVSRLLTLTWACLKTTQFQWVFTAQPHGFVLPQFPVQAQFKHKLELHKTVTYTDTHGSMYLWPG
jgi:hypothetical protein